MPVLDPRLVGAWATARSRARGLALPVADRGAFRVDTGTPDELRRYVFPAAGAGIAAIAAADQDPTISIKLCGTATALAALLPIGWMVEATGYVMRRDGPMLGPSATLPNHYSLKRTAEPGVHGVRVIAFDGQVAAHGWSAAHDGVFIYDRIVTVEAHRRRGLGRFVMHALEAAGWNGRDVQLLVATPAGRALYEMLGWRVISPYSTARRTPI